MDSASKPLYPQCQILSNYCTLYQIGLTSVLRGTHYPCQRVAYIHTGLPDMEKQTRSDPTLHAIS